VAASGSGSGIELRQLPEVIPIDGDITIIGSSLTCPGINIGQVRGN